MSLTLYYHPLSSYCHKVLVALYENGTAFTPHLINLGDQADRQLLSQHWALCKFPVLHDSANGRSFPESSIIIEYLGSHFPGKSRLLPAAGDAALDVRLWDRIMDNHLQTPMQEIVRDRIFNTQLDLSGRRQALDTAYRLLDKQLEGREWLAGSHFSLADCAAVPALFYANVLVPLPAELTQLNAYFERLLARPSVQRVLEEAKPWFHLFPFADALAPRFR